MGMYNAIIDDELLNPLGIYKERLSQSALVAEMGRVGDDEARRRGARGCDDAGMTFRLRHRRGHRADDGAGALSQLQDVHRRAAHRRRLRPRRGRHPVPAGPQGRRARPATSPRACSTTSSGRRCAAATARASCTPGAPLPHFNEVDEGVAVDALVTNRVWTAMGLDPATTLHDVRWGERVRRRVRLGLRDLRLGARRRTSAATTGPCSKRQPPMYFPLGGGTISGVLAGPARSSGRACTSRTAAARRPRPRPRSSSCRTRRPQRRLGRDHAAVADHARRAARRRAATS